MTLSERHPEAFRCPLCGCDVVFIADKRGLHLRHCAECDHYAALPPPTPQELREVYSPAVGYGEGRETSLSETAPAGARQLDALLSQLEPPSHTLLDVGCGDGRLIYHLRNLGWTVAGNDYSPTYVAKASRHGLDVHLGDLEATCLVKGMWGVAHLGDVIEHVVDPIALLASIREYLQPGGLIVVRTPNAASGYSRLSALAARATGTAWLASEAPFHLNDFTPHSLALALERAGYDVRSCSTSGRRPFWYSVGNSGYLDAEKQRLKGHEGRSRYWALVRMVPKLMPVAAWTAVPFLLGRLADLCYGRGDYIMAIASKPDTMTNKNGCPL